MDETRSSVGKNGGGSGEQYKKRMTEMKRKWKEILEFAAMLVLGISLALVISGMLALAGEPSASWFWCDVLGTDLCGEGKGG